MLLFPTVLSDGSVPTQTFLQIFRHTFHPRYAEPQGGARMGFLSAHAFRIIALPELP